MATPALNNLATTLGAPVGSGDTTITVAGTGSWPTPGIFSIDSEVIGYTGKSGTTFTGCTRGIDGTAAATHAATTGAGDPTPVELRIVARHLSEIHTELDSLLPHYTVYYNSAAAQDLFVVPSSYLLYGISIAVIQSFDGTAPTISVGQASGPTEILTTTETDLTQPSGTVFTKNLAITGPYTVRLTNNQASGSTQGQLTMLLKVAPIPGG
jgi:hypothetical protein